MALTSNSLARRKPGVQIPSPPPHIVAGQSVVGPTSAALSSSPEAAGATPGPLGQVNDGGDLLLEGRERVAQQPSPVNERVREATFEQQRCRHRSRLPQDRSSRTLVTTRKSVRHTINVAEESAVSAAREA